MTNDLQPLRPLTLEAQDGSKHAFRPQADMTPLESALISQLFIRMVMSVWNGPVDWPAYVEEHKLDRHFVLIETPVQVWREVYNGTSNLVPETEPEMIRVATLAESFSTDKMYLTVTEPKRVAYVATRDVHIWREGERLTLLEGMPVPDGFVPVAEYDAVVEKWGKGEVR